MRRYSNMAVKSEKIDYRLSCRCCLKSDAEFYKLDSYMIEDVKDRKVSLLQCLIYSIGREDMPELPKYICTGCSRALHIAHTFVQNAQEAHDILCQKLCPERFISKVDKKQKEEKRSSWNNGSRILDGTQSIDDDIHKKENEVEDTTKTLRYRCKVCGEKVHTESALKEHVRKHMDLFAYNCEICNYDTRVLRKIKQHYHIVHNMEPTAQQLNPKAQISKSPIKSVQTPVQSSPTEISTACTLEDMELLIPAAITAKELEERRQTELHNEELKQQQIQSRLKGRPKKVAPKRKRSISQSLANEQINSQIIEPICQPIAPESLQMATVITDPNNLTALTTDLPQFDMHTVALTNELSVGAEFVVKSDGSVEQVMGNGVVIEYINAIPTEDKIYGEDILPSEALNGISTTISSQIDSNEVVEHMNIEDIIVEECGMQQEMSTAALIRMNLKKGLTSEIDPRKTRHRCNECGKVFSTQNRLRNHILTHKNLPRYFCDLCSFDTLVGSDLMRHYESSHHKEGPNKKKPKLVTQSCNTYACDLCLFDTHSPLHLKQHYQIRHKLEPTDVQLRSNMSVVTENLVAAPEPDYKDGLMCAMCPEVFYFRHKYKEHLREHVLADTVGLGQRKQFSPKKSILAPSNVGKVEQSQSQIDPTETLSFVNLPDAGAVTVEHLPTATTKFSLTDATRSDINNVLTITESDNTTSASTISITGCLENLLPTEDISSKVVTEVKPAATLTEITPNLATIGNQPKTTSASMIGDMQDFIDSTDVAAICTIPADAIQVVESDDIVIDSNIDFSFTFEDFDEDDDDEEEEDDDDDDDENKNNDAEIDQNLLLTSDDDDLDDFDDEQSKYLQKPYCIFCHKKFTSQYQFENHMFLHRGLAPYRCEMCTNLYNKKRALLRHYKAVHKRMPTRDMVQARGDKVSLDRTPIETLTIDEQQVLTLMCAKCPYESVNRSELILHLKNHHDIEDPLHIISKLPYECPRCIRSYVTKGSLVRHLQRSHLVATIIEQTIGTTICAAPTKTTTSMPTTTNPVLQSSARTTPKDNRSGGCRNIRSQEEECGESEVLEIVDSQIGDANYDGNDNEKHPVTGTNNYEMDSNAVALESLFDFEYNFIGSGDINEQVVTARMTPAAVERSQETLHVSTIDLARPATTNMKMSAAEPMSDVTHVNNSFQCGICNSTYGSLSLLKCHMKRHISRNFYCEQCTKSFVTRAELERHKPVHDATKQSCFKCEEPGCEKVFTYKHHLKRHQDVAHLLKRFLCPLEGCFRQFTTNTQFKRHMLCHKGAQFPYKCTACQKRFSRRKVLQRHALEKHKITLSENDVAEIYRSNVGHTNPCDMKFYNFNDVQLECLFVTSEKVSVVEEPPEQTMLDMPLQCSATEAAKAVVNILNT